MAEANDGNEALEKYKETAPDLVTMDITMPDKDGISALKEIKEYDPNANVIMCSAMGQQAMVIDAIQAGAKDFIVKPFQADRSLMPFLKQSVKGLLFVVVVLCFALVEHEHALAKDCSVQEAMESEACASSDAEVEETAVATESPWVSGLKMIGALLVVIFFTCNAIEVINKRSRSFQEAKGLSLLSGVSLGGNRSVQLVRVGEKLLVIGVSDQVQLLDTIDDPDEMEAILKKHQPEGEQGGLTQVLPWLKTADNQRQSSSTFQDILTSRLNLENQGLKKKVRMHDEGPKSL